VALALDVRVRGSSRFLRRAGTRSVRSPASPVAEKNGFFREDAWIAGDPETQVPMCARKNGRRTSNDKTSKGDRIEMDPRNLSDTTSYYQVDEQHVEDADRQRAFERGAVV
jgi:hypothetical protein